MGWEERRNGNRYYYEKRWEGGRCRSVYIGRGEVAAAIAGLNEIERRQRGHGRARELAGLEAAAANVGPALALLAELDLLATGATRGALHAAGYHQHDRGEWRRKRGA